MQEVNVIVLQSPLSPHSMLTDERLKQRETEFSIQAETIANQHY